MYAHIRPLLIGRPLMVTKSRLDAILQGIGPRLYGAPRCVDGEDDGDHDEPGMATWGAIAVLEIRGTLTNRRMAMTPMSEPLLDYGTIRGWYQAAMADNGVSRIVAMIDSNGGDAVGCMELAAYIASLRGTKPMDAVIVGNCASAAYAIASAHDRITMTPSGYAGSVGVVAVHVDESGANEQDGIKYTYVYAGAHKIDFNPDSPLSDDARSELQADIDATYTEFVGLVATNRGMTPQAVQATEARLYLGRAAVTAGLVDQIADPYQFMDSLLQPQPRGNDAMAFDATMAAAIVAECNAAGLYALTPQYIKRVAEGMTLDQFRTELSQMAALKTLADTTGMATLGAAILEGKTGADLIHAGAADMKATADRVKAEVAQATKGQRLEVLAGIDEAADIKSQVNPGGKSADNPTDATAPVPVEKVYEFRRNQAKGA